MILNYSIIRNVKQLHAVTDLSMCPQIISIRHYKAVDRCNNKGRETRLKLALPSLASTAGIIGRWVFSAFAGGTDFRYYRTTIH